jgi:predicted DNA-binding transcriptional regulator YafY
MSEIARLYRYKSLLSGRGAVSTAKLMAELEISRATFRRDIAKLRDQLHMPIRFDRDLGGYVVDAQPQDSELPGLWFSPQEVLALVTLQHLLAQLEPGLLGPKLKPIQGRLASLMEQNGLSSQDVAARVRVLHAGKRTLAPPLFEAVASATLARKRLRIDHYNRQNGQTVSREVSPQRVVHYRDNWYLDAWCHLRNDLRSFAIDAIERMRHPGGTGPYRRAGALAPGDAGQLRHLFGCS